MYVYMHVTKDKYELPLAVADSVKELADLVGVHPNDIHGVIYRARIRGSKRSKYVKVKIDDGED